MRRGLCMAMLFVGVLTGCGHRGMHVGTKAIALDLLPLTDVSKSDEKNIKRYTVGDWQGECWYLPNDSQPISQYWRIGKYCPVELDFYKGYHQFYAKPRDRYHAIYYSEHPKLGRPAVAVFDVAGGGDGDGDEGVAAIMIFVQTDDGFMPVRMPEVKTVATR